MNRVWEQYKNHLLCSTFFSLGIAHRDLKPENILCQYKDQVSTINPMCPTNDGIEDTEHFLLLCPTFDVPRRDLLAGVSALLRPLGHTNPSNEFLNADFIVR